VVSSRSDFNPITAIFRKRLVKTPKLYFYDPGLAVRLLGIESADQLVTHPLRGALFENWVITELLKGRAAVNPGLWSGAQAA